MNRPTTLALTFLTLTLAACGRPASTPAVSTDDTSSGSVADAGGHGAGGNGAAGHGDHALAAPGPDRSRLPSRAVLGPATVAPGLRVQTLPANVQPNLLALKVLILSSGPSDYGIGTARALLDQSGIPYDVLDASRTPLDTAALIAPDGSGRYQGVILTDSALIMDAGNGTYPSALDSAEWDTLFEYERTFRVRQLALYGAPGSVPEDYGLRYVAGAETATTSLRLNAAGQAVFSDLKGAAIPVTYSYTYPSALQSVPGVSTQVLATDPSGRVLAATSTSADGRERLILTSAQNPYLTHSQLLGRGLAQWLTRGVHLGEHRRFLQVDIDDVFLEGDHLTSALTLTAPFRLSGSDLLNVRTQQDRLRSNYPAAPNFRYALMFNGGGANTAVPTLCTNSPWLTRDLLSSVARCLNTQFDWVNHTLDHQRMDVMPLSTATTQIQQNLSVGTKLGLNMSRASLVTGEHSGLGFMDPTDDGTRNDDGTAGPKQDLGLGRSNPNLLSAAVSSGVTYLASDHSVASQWDAQCPTCGVPHPLNPGVFLVPRWPNSVAYHVTTPDEATAFYNSLYGPGGLFPYWDRNLTYAEFLDRESDQALTHILNGTPFPHFMHQPNLRQYAGGKSLATDWVQAALVKYSTYSKLPLNTLRWDDLGAQVRRHTAEVKASAAGTLSGTWNRSAGTVRLTSSAGTVPVTLSGASSGTLYGTDRAARYDLSGSLDVPVTPR
ncbi:hypothetical protein [Deinococcus aquaticus]|uniref:Agd3 CBM87 domain-containing protein n=1 Tax=Deinococcus aquaticus TaxID=328692 RepID=A0ABY7V6Y2_9DEIO|nr:hypothetical protein [Deinococcus aquaticus]WDA60384.1 hypothetical protein M8445_15315 [Deinococcus aquaticus]